MHSLSSGVSIPCLAVGGPNPTVATRTVQEYLVKGLRLPTVMEEREAEMFLVMVGRAEVRVTM